MATCKETVQEISSSDSNNQPDEQLRDHIEKFLTPDEIEYLCANLRVVDLREMAAGVLIAGIEHLKGNCSQLEFATLINSWLATAEETVSGGKAAGRIAARRNKVKLALPNSFYDIVTLPNRH